MTARFRTWGACVVVAALLMAVTGAGAATNVFAVVSSGISAYVINGASNPGIRLVRGFDYIFNVNAFSHPFWIKTVPGTGTLNAYNDGVTGNGTAVGTITFSVPPSAPDNLFYNCQIHAAMTGVFFVEDPPTVRIQDLQVTTNILVASDGTDALQVMVESSTNLVAGVWSPESVTSNQYVSGTNFTQVALPASSNTFIRVLQGFP